MSNSAEVLDTFKFKDEKIFLKRFHAERTYEALAFKEMNIGLTEVVSFYDRIEKEFSAKLTARQLMRVSIAMGSFNPKVEVIEKSFFPENPGLQIISSIIAPSGLGAQNFKWTHREFWNQLLSLKDKKADDVIAVNNQGQITETSRCNIFCFDSTYNITLTPAVDAGCINGVYRRYVLKNGFIELPGLGRKKVIEKSIFTEDLKNYSIFIANSVREVVSAHIIEII